VVVERPSLLVERAVLFDERPFDLDED